MANNTTNVWKWDGRTSTAWRDANWTDGSDTAVDDFPDAATDIVTMSSSATNAMVACAAPTTVGSITQAAGYAGAVCVANLTAATVTAVANGMVTGGTITTLNASGNAVVSGGTITTANLSGTATLTGGTVTTLNLSGAAHNTGGTVLGVTTVNSTAVQYGTWGTDIVCNGNTTFDGDNDFNSGGDPAQTNIKPKKRDTTVAFAIGAHTWAGKPIIQYSGGPYSALWMAGHS